VKKHEKKEKKHCNGSAISGFGPTGKIALANLLGTNCKMDWRVDSATLGI
jgi:hypothetical protein